MNIIDFFASENRENYIEQIRACDWSAAKFLAELLEQGTFFQTLGGKGRLLLLLDGETVAAFLTLTAQDCIRDESMQPWIGFVYTSAPFRGRRLSQSLIAHAEDLAKADGHRRVYIATDHIGLYEKFGYQYLENRIDCWGDDSRILYKDL